MIRCYFIKLCRPAKILSCLLTRVNLFHTEDDSTPQNSYTLTIYVMEVSHKQNHPSIIRLWFQPMHTLFLLEGERFPLATSRGLFSPGAITAASHTRLNLKRQVNCCSLRINRAIYLALSFWVFSLLLFHCFSISVFFLPSFFFLLGLQKTSGGSIQALRV